MLFSRILVLTVLFWSAAAPAQQRLEQKPRDSAYEKFEPLRAPKPGGLLLKKRDRLAICGDSITEQKMYSRLMEDYLTMCAPDLGISVRQYGWSGERAPGFLARMTNDCLRFGPTVATTCYGMNDHQYRPYEERIGMAYRDSSWRIIEAFKANGVRVVQGSPGCVGKMPSWVKEATGTVEDLNMSLCKFRNIGLQLAETEKVRFADVFWPMYKTGIEARKRFDGDYAIAGKDGVHPGWAGHTVMAHAFLKALGLQGSIGTLIVNPDKGKMRASAGHELLSSAGNSFTLKSSRYPFCPCLEEGSGTAGYPVCGKDDPSRDDSIRSAMDFVPFNQELNRFVLMAKNGKAASYRVTWGEESRTFTAGQLSKGINLAAEFPHNPFSRAFAAVDAAVAAKQAYETKQIKQLFRSPEAKGNMEQVAAASEVEHQRLAQAVQAAFVPVIHTIKIEAQ